jgi:PhnB protein
MAQISPFIHFNGNTEEAFTFYKSVFGGEFAKIARYRDISSPEYPIADRDANRIMHITLPIGKSNSLMGGDVLEMMGQVMESDNRYTVTIRAESKEEAHKLYNGLSKAGKVEVPFSETPAGTYFGMFADKFGVRWMVDFDSTFSGQN